MSDEKKSWWRRLFEVRWPRLPGPPIRRGIYHFRREGGGNVTRFHLRVEEDGSGMLLANASVAARLSAPGVLIAKLLLEEKDAEEIRKLIRKNFRGVRNDAFQSDLEKLQSFLETMANPEDNYPIFNLDDPSVGPPRGLMAPFHAQVPVSPVEQITPVLQRLWDCGVAHVTFHASRGSDPEEAVADVERAEDLGMICGISAVAGWMLAPNLFERLAMAGVDSLAVPVVFPEEPLQDFLLGPGDFSAAMMAFSECFRLEVCPVAVIPLFKDNVAEIEAILEMLSRNRVRNVLYYGIADPHQPAGLNRGELIEAAQKVEDLAHKMDVRYVWLPAVSRAGNLSDILEEGPRCAGDVSVRVEPDGSVIPARGARTVAGNLLADSWDAIWSHPGFRHYRERVEAPTRCDVCPGLEICAADCPGEPAGFAEG